MKTAMLFALLTMTATPAVAGHDDGPKQGIAVLTPGSPTMLHATSLYVLDNTALSSAANITGMRLTRLAQTQGFDPAERFAEKLLFALEFAGWDVVHTKVTRPTRFGVSLLERDSLPPNPDARWMLDSNFVYLALATRDDYPPFRPAIAVNYRVLRDDGNMLQGSRRIFYRQAHVNFVGSVPGSAPVGARAQYAEFNADPSCAFDSFKAMEKNTDQLWACIDDAFDRLARKIVEELPHRQIPSQRSRLLEARDE